MNICIFGDSITWGANDSERGGWAERLKQHFIEQGGEHEVYNLGMTGETAATLLKHFDAEAAVREPDVLIFAIGINDAQYINEPSNRVTSVDDFLHHLDLLNAKAQRHTPYIMFLGMTHVDEAKTLPISWAPDRNYTNERIAEYDEALKKWCDEVKVKYVSMADVVTKEQVEDGVHPNAAGHEAMCTRVREALGTFL